MLPYRVKETLEREVKLRPLNGFHLPQQLVQHPQPKRIFTSTYYDTKSFALARLGITLRRRMEGGKGVWQLKLPADHARRELEIPHGSSKLPAEFADLLFAFFRGQDPIPVTKLRTERQPHEVKNHEHTLAEITWDRVAVLENRRICKRLSELEIELVEGTDKNLRQITRQLKEAGAEEASFRPKMCQALNLEYPESEQTLEAGATPAEHVKWMLKRQVDEILRHDPGTRFGKDPEDLHKMRVATRRSRALLRTARPLLDPERNAVLRREINWLAKILGTIRDFDVLLQKLQKETQALPPSEQRFFETLLTKLESQRSIARASMLEALRSDRYLALLDRLISASICTEIIHPNIALQDLANKEFDKLTKAVHNLPKDYTDEDLHRLRIRAKRVRYAAELAEQCAGKAAARFIKQIRKFQDLLGDHQDTVMMEQQLQNFLQSSRKMKAAFTSGLIVERLRRRRTKLRGAFPHRWHKLKKHGNAIWT